MCALPKIAILILALLPQPDAAAGWAWREQPRTYAPDTLYEYINGAADLYLSYGFEEVAVADYVQTEGADGWITVDIYDMGAPLHAFGIYGSERPPDVEAFPVGAQGYVCEGLIAFWQGDYYVKVMLDQLLGEDNFRSERLRNGLERSPVARSPVWADRDGLPRPLHTVRPIVVRRRGVEFEIG